MIRYRVKMTIEQIRQESILSLIDPETAKTAGIMSLVDVENMGFCKDGKTRWYYFTNAAGKPAAYYEY